VFEVAGYIIATIVYLFGLLCVFHKGRHKSNALIAAGFTAVAYGIFSQLLNVQLPLGPLSF
jgi:putative tricarboxylic transport membrane protein